jgi:hypothetical protein
MSEKTTEKTNATPSGKGSVSDDLLSPIGAECSLYEIYPLKIEQRVPGGKWYASTNWGEHEMDDALAELQSQRKKHPKLRTRLIRVRFEILSDNATAMASADKQPTDSDHGK